MQERREGAALASVAYQLVRYVFPDYLLLVCFLFVLCFAVFILYYNHLKSSDP